ncbi:hypothetical protein ACSV5M_10655 [Cellvibrio sp. ARAG 10.3]|uniref:hypothetical protein n=1 Tax=Cellvibrio sp. ARAG 10.3 TaxID=3451358 RepID=UPI003F469F07
MQRVARNVFVYSTKTAHPALKRTKTYHSLAQGDIFSWKNDFKEPLENVCEAASARQKQEKKRSLHRVNEHFELVFNAAMATQVIFQRFLRKLHDGQATHLSRTT